MGFSAVPRGLPPGRYGPPPASVVRSRLIWAPWLRHLPACTALHLLTRLDAPPAVTSFAVVVRAAVRRRPAVLVELGLVKALSGRVRGARRCHGGRCGEAQRRGPPDRPRLPAGVYRQGPGSFADRSSSPASCPHQMPPTEARIVELRRAYPAWGPRRMHVLGLGRDGRAVREAVAVSACSARRRSLP